MRTRERTAGALLLFLAMIQMNAGPLVRMGSSANSTEPAHETRRAPERLKTVAIPEPTSAIVRKDAPLSLAYYDAMKILGGSNQCSNFFGGAESSTYVFSNFMAGVKRSQLPSGIGVKMSGDYTNVINNETKLKFRLFDKASVNTAGPFYQRKTSPSGPTVFGVGSFPASSREARVLMLLHELGHLMKGSDGKWLLPDDGNNMEGSVQNTKRIELICGEQIRELDKPMDLELARQNSSEQTVSPTGATSNH